MEPVTLATVGAVATIAATAFFVGATCWAFWKVCNRLSTVEQAALVMAKKLDLVDAD